MALHTTKLPLGRMAPLLAVALLIGCWSPPKKRFPEASDEGRRACIEEVQANYAAQGRVEAMKKCLTTIDQRLGERKHLEDRIKESSSPPQPTGSGPSQQSRLIYCRMHQKEIQEAERERQRLQSQWMVASNTQLPESKAYIEAKNNYLEAIALLEEMIPENMRNGLPLIPEAISAFSQCDQASTAFND